MLASIVCKGAVAYSSIRLVPAGAVELQIPPLRYAPVGMTTLFRGQSLSRFGLLSGRDYKVLATTFSHSIEQLSAADWIVESLAKVKVAVLPEGQGVELTFPPLAR